MQQPHSTWNGVKVAYVSSFISIDAAITAANKRKWSVVEYLQRIYLFVRARIWMWTEDVTPHNSFIQSKWCHPSDVSKSVCNRSWLCAPFVILSLDLFETGDEWVPERVWRWSVTWCFSEEFWIDTVKPLCVIIFCWWTRINDSWSLFCNFTSWILKPVNDLSVLRWRCD